MYDGDGATRTRREKRDGSAAAATTAIIALTLCPTRTTSRRSISAHSSRMSRA